MTTERNVGLACGFLGLTSIARTGPCDMGAAVTAVRNSGWHRSGGGRDDSVGSRGRGRVSGEGSGAEMSPIRVHFYCRTASAGTNLHDAYRSGEREMRLSDTRDFGPPRPQMQPRKPEKRRVPAGDG